MSKRNKAKALKLMNQIADVRSEQARHRRHQSWLYSELTMLHPPASAGADRADLLALHQWLGEQIVAAEIQIIKLARKLKGIPGVNDHGVYTDPNYKDSQNQPKGKKMSATPTPAIADQQIEVMYGGGWLGGQIADDDYCKLGKQVRRTDARIWMMQNETQLRQVIAYADHDLRQHRHYIDQGLFGYSAGHVASCRRTKATAIKSLAKLSQVADATS